MAIIDGLLPRGDWSPGERAVVKRLVHTSGDPSLAASVRFSAGAVEAGAAALRSGASVFTDTHMVRIGVNESRVRSLRGGAGVPDRRRGDRRGVEAHRPHAGGVRHARLRPASGRRRRGRGQRADGPARGAGSGSRGRGAAGSGHRHARRLRRRGRVEGGADGSRTFRSWPSRARAAAVRWPPPR